MSANSSLLVCLRHGESAWNADNRFCGWVDVDLSQNGLKEAQTALNTFKGENFEFDIIFSSVLKRALQTASIVAPNKQIVQDWRLVERHYGALTGLNKAEMIRLHGKDQVAIWRRSYDVRPPPMQDNHPFFNEIQTNPSLAMVKDKPRCEALKDLVERTIPFFQQEVTPLIQQGKKILIVAHGTSLRSLVAHIEGLSEDEVTKLNLPTGIPFVYEISSSNMERFGSRRYLADEETVRRAVDKTANVANKE